MPYKAGGGSSWTKECWKELLRKLGTVRGTPLHLWSGLSNGKTIFNLDAELKPCLGISGYEGRDDPFGCATRIVLKLQYPHHLILFVLQLFCLLASSSWPPLLLLQTELQDLLKPISDHIQEIQNFREQNRGSCLFNHLSAVSESIPALGWVAVVRKNQKHCLHSNHIYCKLSFLWVHDLNLDLWLNNTKYRLKQAPQ